ncbi:hypothetical protein M8C21_016844, partial [Ambrosia artemisiifolia]
PLLPPYSKAPRLPEQNEITIPPTLTPNEFKDMLIFGSPRDSPLSASLIVDPLDSPNLSTLFSDSNNIPVNEKKKRYHPSYIIDFKKGRMRIRMKVGLALGVVVLCIGLGVGVMHFVENLGWLDCFYLSVMSVTTVGYGDIAFSSAGGRAFACVWLLVSTLAVARAFLYLAEARVDKRHRRMVKWVLGQDLTVAQFLAADIDNNGSVSKAEYVIYKLKEMGKVTEKDILQICAIFDQLDTGNSGKISLADLMQSRTDRESEPNTHIR